MNYSSYPWSIGFTFNIIIYPGSPKEHTDKLVRQFNKPGGFKVSAWKNPSSFSRLSNNCLLLTRSHRPSCDSLLSWEVFSLSFSPSLSLPLCRENCHNSV